MRPEDWEKVKRIFETAVKLNAAERSVYLVDACADDSALLRTVSELLQANDEAQGFLEEKPITELVAQVFEVGQLVAERFRIIRLISRGGMGEVYETFDERLGVRLALKTLRQEYAGDLDALERFRREIRVTRDISHPNLCRVYELVEHRMAPDQAGSHGRLVTCLTMQLISGENLEQYLAKAGRLSPDVALPLIRQIAGAIGVLHDNGIVHRDLKPSNVMITRSAEGELRAIVMDFGLAKLFDGEKETFKSRSSFNAGAPFFLAPELVRGERPSVASDIYAFGLIVDEMVTGGGAFTGDTVASILYQKLWSDPEDPQKRVPDLPYHWCQAIRHCLHRHPAKRSSSAALVVRELSEALGDTQLVPVLPRVVRRIAPHLPHLSPRSLKRFWLLAIVCLIALTSGSAYIEYLGSRPLNTSVVIFEFENLTGKTENDYLSKGITREVARRLYQIPGMQVLPFHTIRPKDGRVKLDSRFSLDGMLQANKSVTRISVELIDNTKPAIVFANAFEHSAGDTLEMQSTIASSLVDAMRDSVLMPAAKDAGGFPEVVSSLFHWVALPGARQALAPPTKSSVAMQFYMRGHSLLEQRTLASLEQARELDQQAIKEDSNFALAYSDLALIEWTLLQFNAFPRSQLLESANAHAKQAVKTGPTLPESYVALAVARQYAWDLAGAELNYRKAIALNPKLANPHREYGGLLIGMGRLDEGLKENRTAISLDPYNPDRQFFGTYLIYAGHFDEAIQFMQTFVADTDSEQAHQILGYAYAGLATRNASDRPNWVAKALREADAVAKSEAHTQKPIYSGRAIAMYALFHAIGGDSKQAQRYLNLLLMGEKDNAVDFEDVVMIFTALGNLDAAQRYLDRAWETRDTSLAYIKVNPFLDPLRSSPRFRALLSQAGLGSQ